MAFSFRDSEVKNLKDWASLYSKEKGIYYNGIVSGFTAYGISENNITFVNYFEDTKECLKNVAGGLKLCDNQRLKELGYHRINFLRHRYFMLYRIEGELVFIDKIFHDLQDYEGRMI